MRKPIASFCTLALLMPMPATIAQTGSAGSDERRPMAVTEMNLCRQPLALPDLGKEVDRAQQQTPTRTKRSDLGRSTRTADIVPPPVAVAAPPPPSRPVREAAEESSSIIVTGSRLMRPDSTRSAEAADSAAASDSDYARAMPGYPTLPAPPLSPGPQPQPQSGLLTAGEHDDLLNPELYAQYVRNSDLGQKARDLPLLDTARLLTVEARDRRGQPMPFVPVEVRCANGKSIILNTVADGRAVFFPGFDRLGSTVNVRVAGERWRRVDLTADEGTQTIGFTMGDRAQAVRKLDLALVVDVTGSMSDELRFLQAELTAIVDQLNRRHPGLDIRVGFTFYRDEGDDFVTRTFALDGDMARAKTMIAAQSANGGGDYEEAMQDAMIRAANQPWRDDAVKSLLLVADAPPHDRDVEMTWRAAEHLRAKRVHIVPVGASGVADMAEYIMRAMAASTQSRYTFLTDDSGIGNPHADPAIDCYLVTRLDALLRRVIDSQISGRRIEPEKSEIIRAVGQYESGRCVLPAGFAQKAAGEQGA